MRKHLKTICLALLSCCMLAGCSKGVRQDTKVELSHEDAEKEMEALLKKVKSDTVENPALDIYSDSTAEADALADISVFPLTVTGTGEINIEVAGATELTADSAPDDLLNVIARNFNKEHMELDGKTVSVSVRQITSGEAVTYMEAGKYSPQLFIPSAYPWGEMLESSGIGTVQLTDRICGNTAGLLIKQDVYKEFMGKYKEPTMENILTAAVERDIVFAYTNPYTSTTGLNATASILKAFDPDDPLSGKAAEKFLEYQKTSPPVAYTTAVLRSQAAKGVINAMVMEEQAYINTAELKGYEYIPFGVRHDHPAYTFDYCTPEESEAAKMFVEYCMSDKNQKLATEKGFNRHEEYQSQDPGLDGTGWLTAQKIWKQNKNGGKPIAAVFIADVSGSMDGEPINSLKRSLTECSAFISQEHYIGLVSYDTDVTINLPVKQFDAAQRAYFAGEVKNLSAGGNTATYDAVLTGLDMLEEAAEGLPDAKLMVFVLTDGQQNEGYSLNRITPVVRGLQVPVYTISYNYSDNNKELETLSGINEAAALKADSTDIVNQLRNLFNVEM